MKYTAKQLVLSCEHGGNQIPAHLKKFIHIPQEILKSHRGLDIGALKIAEKLSKDLKAPLISNTLSRLVIEYNRSLHHPQIYSQYSKDLPDLQKKLLIKDYQVYRNRLKEMIETEKRYLHLSIHSFTPILNGDIRDCDIGLLYDPRNSLEKNFCHQLKKNLTQNDINCRLNYPYKGTADGLTTSFRKLIKGNYLGIEVEFNQGLVTKPSIYNIFTETINNLIG